MSLSFKEKGLGDASYELYHIEGLSDILEDLAEHLNEE